MGLFDFLKRRPNFHRFDDSYALNRQSLYLAIHAAIESQRRMGRIVLLVAHFPDEFERLQNWLSDSGLDYEIVTRPIDRSWMEQAGRFAGKSILLVISDLIPEDWDTAVQSPPSSERLSMIVCERHPDPAEDDKLMKFARANPVPTQLGYFVALDDPVVRAVLPESLVKLMQQLGMSDQELIASNLVSKRLGQALKKQATRYQSRLPADSAEQWLKLNWPQD